MRHLLLSIILLNTHLYATSEVPLSNLPNEIGEEPNDEFGFREKIRNYYYQKRYDTINPHAPFAVQYWPVEIELPKEHEVPTQFLQANGKLRLDKISQSDVHNLCDQELYNLLGPLSQVKVKVQWKDRSGNIKSGKNHKHNKLTLGLAKTDDTNAAAALIMAMGAMGNTFEFCRMLSLIPDAVMPELKGHGIAIFSAESIALALILMVNDLTHKDTTSIAHSTTKLLGIYLKYHAKKNNRQLEKNLHQIITKIYLFLESSKTKVADALFSPGTYNEMQIGIIFGSILSAAIIHANNISDSDEKRVFLVNTGSNLIWASTAFLGAAPMGSACATAIVGGVISLGTVGAAAVYSKWGVHTDSIPTTKELEGRIQAAILKKCENATNETKSKIFAMLHWMNTTIHLNGLPD